MAIFSRGRSLLLGSALCLALSGSKAASALPIVSGFDGDTPGQPPALGGSGQPSGFHPAPFDAEVVVADLDIGMAPPALVVSVSSQGFAGVYWELPLVERGVLRAEVTASVSRTDVFISSFFQTLVAPTDAVVSRLRMNPGGELFAGEVRVGAVAADQPFRARMDVDLDAGAWSAVVDDELDGFDDDPVFAGIALINPPGVLPGIGAVSLDVLGEQVAVAFDDLSVRSLPEANAASLAAAFGLFSALRLRSRRR